MEELLGTRIERLRKARGMSRPDFCEDESQLSIRQLVRIEKGESQPTISRMHYIAKRLGVPAYTLIPDYQELSKRYLELKYLILRKPAYQDESEFDNKDKLFDEIYENYYYDLPEDEKLIVDTLQAIYDILRSKDSRYGDNLLMEQLDNLRKKEILNISDLLLIRLYFIKVTLRNDTNTVKLALHFLQLLLEQSEFTKLEDFFILRDAIFGGLPYFETINNYDLWCVAVECLEEIVEKTQDFQKKPLILMLEWKFQLVREKNFSSAESYYQQAKQFATMIGDARLKNNLEQEWKKDLRKHL
ncbi:helix-turn-helix domain-containing protein [Ligilactobacillus animalis]|uniref:helix-turn-helix domain-containing protein n=1 Tax=Ligilactobacillus animalis TaxID=1605 RepID=UPI0035121C75